MKVTSTLNPLFIAMAATIAPCVQAADEASPEGFVEGASLQLNARNYYMNRNRHQQAPDNIEWGQGFLGIFESGYTQGTVGFGIDANAMLGLKLDGGAALTVRASCRSATATAKPQRRFPPPAPP